MQAVRERKRVAQKSAKRGASPRSSRQTELMLEAEPPQRSFLSRWSAAGLILVAAALAVLFVANAIHVNELLRGVTSVEAERDAVKRENEGLRAELTRLMSVDQITERATGIGMIQPEKPPKALSLRNSELQVNP
ncbi:MAG: hypothetical protein J4G05_06680 [Chlorobi bacterium]|nr:hypothetical protein [Chlorobiota bacterium]